MSSVLPVVQTIVFVALGIALGLFLIRRKSDRYLHQATTALNDGGVVELYVSLRLPDEGTTWWGRRWRQGSIRISPGGDAQFVPYRPRKAKHFDLTGIELVGEAPSSRTDHLWFESKTKLLASSPTHERIQMGFGPGPWAELAHKAIPPVARANLGSTSSQ